MSRAAQPSKKDAILQIARQMNVPRFSPAEIEQVRRQLIVRLGEEGQTSADYVASVLEESGLRVVRSLASDTGGRYEQEFEDLLHFSTLEDAEVCLIRLDELLRKFEVAGEHAAAERVREVGRLGRRRAAMIAKNPKVDPHKRAEKQEIVEWFALWLQTPDIFFNWLELRKQSPEFQRRFGDAGEPE